MKRRVITTNVDCRVFHAVSRRFCREEHAAAGEGLFQLLDDGGNDRLFLTGQFAGSLERGHVERPHRYRAVVDHVFRAVEVEKDDLAGGVGVRIDERQAGKVRQG